MFAFSRAQFRGFWEKVRLPALRNYQETDFSFHFAGALSFHFRWCWGWGTLYDTQAENSGKVAPGDPPLDPCLLLTRGCLWKFEAGPLPDSCCCSPCYRWHLEPPPPRSGPTRAGASTPGGQGTGLVTALAVRGCRHPRREAGPVPPPAPAAGETPAPHGVLFGFPWRLFSTGLFVFLQITDAGKTAWHHESGTNAHFEGFLGRTSSEIICLRRTWYRSRENNQFWVCQTVECAKCSTFLQEAKCPLKSSIINMSLKTEGARSLCLCWVWEKVHTLCEFLLLNLILLICSTLGKVLATVHELSSVHICALLSKCVHKEGKCVNMGTKSYCFLMTEGYQPNEIKSKIKRNLCVQ